MMQELGVDLIHAGSSQAKGRIERLWNTLHDRLRTKFRRHNSSDIEGAKDKVAIRDYTNKYVGV